MGAINPLVSTILSPLNAIQQITGQAKRLSGERDAEKLALRQLQEQQNLEYRQSAAQAELNRQTLAAQSAAEETARREALRRAAARQRAAFGGGGVSTNGGSGEAVLLGLFEESDEERAQREKLDTLKSRAIDMSLENKRSLNVLQRSQLAARQKIQGSLF